METERERVLDWAVRSLLTRGGSPLSLMFRWKHGPIKMLLGTVSGELGHEFISPGVPPCTKLAVEHWQLALAGASQP